MRKFTNRYIFIYAAIMVILVAALLSSVAMSLQPRQEQNMRIEKIQNILSAAGINVDKQHADSMYNKKIIREVAVDTSGRLISWYVDQNLEIGTQRPFDIDVKHQLSLQDKFRKGKTSEVAIFPVFVCQVDADNLVYILPLQGNGLWGPVWGYVALKDDFNTIQGATFDHKGETPGLGAEIATAQFSDQFAGKQIFDANKQYTSVKVVKGGVKNSRIDPKHGVDAISGGTITSQGVSDMLYNCLNNYQAYFKKELTSSSPLMSEDAEAGATAETAGDSTNNEVENTTNE